MSLLKKILGLFKKEEKIEEKVEKEVEEKPEKIVLSSLPGGVPGLQAQTEIIIEDEGVDIDEEENIDLDGEENINIDEKENNE
mgnify:CR=1 FL=1